MSSVMPAYLESEIAAIESPLQTNWEEAYRRLDNLTKPIGSLGRLESLAAQYSAIVAGDIRLPLRAGVYIFAADHGIAIERVSAYPPEVTAQMVQNFLRGGAAVNVLAKLHDVALTIVDVGVNTTFDDHPGLIQAKVRPGSRNFLREPAMSPEELKAALCAGVAQAKAASEAGYQLVAVGEMGIGNTTAASAMTSILTGISIAEVTGHGTGLDDSGRNRKLNVIRKALRLHFPKQDEVPAPIEILRCVGGLEIAAMTGFMLAAAERRLAIVVDGFISTAAAGIACALSPRIKDYLFAGHSSPEPGHRHLLKHLDLKPIMRLEMRLGEGTGAVLAIPVIRSAVHLYCEMATFSSAGVSTSSL